MKKIQIEQDLFVQMVKYFFSDELGFDDDDISEFYGELVDIANAAIWQYRDMYLRPDFYVNNLEKVRLIIAPVIEDYKSGKISYEEAEFNARTKIYQSVKPDFDPNVEYMKDPFSRDIPSVDNSLFILAKKLLLDSKV